MKDKKKLDYIDNKLTNKKNSKIGRPKVEKPRSNIVHLRFTDEETKEIDNYINKFKYKNRSELIREATIQKIRQLNINVN